MQPGCGNSPIKMCIIYRSFSCLAQFLIQLDLWRVITTKPYNLGCQKNLAKIWIYVHNIYIDMCIYVLIIQLILHMFGSILRLLKLFCLANQHITYIYISVHGHIWTRFICSSKSQCVVSNAIKCCIWVRPQSMWFIYQSISVYHFPMFL